MLHNNVFTYCKVRGFETRRFSNHESRLLSRAHTFGIIVIWDLKIHQSMWIHWSFFPKTWTKGHWPLHDLWPHVCWGHMCDSTQGSLCPSPMTIHQCMWIQWSILQITTYIHILRTYYILHTYYVQNEWSHSLVLNSVQARQKRTRTIIDLLGNIFIHNAARSRLSPQMAELCKERIGNCCGGCCKSTWFNCFEYKLAKCMLPAHDKKA